MRPRRKVERTVNGWEVHGGEFVTTDETLAWAVARDMDRRDPLPCEHNGEWIEITTLREPPGSEFMRQCCSERWHRGVSEEEGAA